MGSSLAATCVSAQVRTYDGGGADDDWTNPLNWSGDDVPDSTSEDAVINAGGSWDVDFAGRIDIDSLTVGSNDVLNLLDTILDTELDLSGDLNNNGTINLNIGDTRIAFLSSNTDINGNGEIVLRGGLARIEGNNRVTQGPSHTIEGRGVVQSITNRGLVQANVNNGTLGVFNSTNDGQFRAINGGTLRLTNTDNVAGTIEANGGTVRIEGDIVGGSLSTTGSGVIEVSAGSFEDLSVSGNVEVELGGLDVEGEIINNASITFTSSIADLRLSDDTTLDGIGELVMRDDLNSRISGSSSRMLTNGSNHTIRGGAFVEVDLRNNGLISADRNNEDIRFRNNIDVTNRGTIEATGDGQLRLEATFDNTFGLIRSVNDAVVELDGATIEDGTLTGTGFRVTDDSDLISLAIGNDAEIEIRSGHVLSLDEVDIGNDADVEIRSGGVLSVDGFVDNDGRVLVRSDGTLRGNGVLSGAGSGLLNQGIIAPGLSAGSLAITGGSVNFTDTSVLDIELGGTTAGTGHDRLVVSNTANLDGLLDVSLIDAFTPTLGDSFAILSAGAVSGTFDSVAGTDLGNGLALDVVYAATSVSLEVINALLLAGDYDGSGQVEQADLNLVLANWGTSRTFSDPGGTAFATTIVDQEELNLVLSNWGSTAVPSFGGFTVPEPASALLLALCGLRHRRSSPLGAK
ncbi:MAG: hypothetical protein AAGJ38_02660 [Planctomycetota bacterium]